MVSSEDRAISADLPLLRELDREVRRGCTTLESEWSGHGEWWLVLPEEIRSTRAMQYLSTYAREREDVVINSTPRHSMC